MNKVLFTLVWLIITFQCSGIHNTLKRLRKMTLDEVRNMTTIPSNSKLTNDFYKKKIRTCIEEWESPCEESRCLHQKFSSQKNGGTQSQSLGTTTSSRSMWLPSTSDLLIGSSNPSQNIWKLKGLRIAGIGDSIGLQAFNSLRCYLLNIKKINVEFRQFFPLHTVFLNRDHLYRYLKEGLVDVDIAFIGIGTWYLNTESDTENHLPFYDKTYQLIDHCRQPNKIRRELSEPPPKGAGFEVNNCNSLDKPFSYTYAFKRRKCGSVLLGDSAFYSDLALLNEVLEYDRNTEQALPPIIWKDIPPQHFPFAPSGKWKNRLWSNTIDPSNEENMNNNNMSKFGDKKYKCAPIQSRSTAYSLNAIADNLIVNHGNSSSGFAGIARSWELDVKAWDLHPYGDCTHYCSKSNVVRNWGESIANAMLTSDHGLKYAFERFKKRSNSNSANNGGLIE